MNSMIEVRNLSVSYDGKKAFDSISFSMAARQIVGVIGPNGAGKSTLIKAILGLLKADGGSVTVMNQPVSTARKRIAYVPQRNTIDFDFPALVEDVVMMGRYPHISWWGFPGANDRQVVEDSLKRVGMLELRKRQIGQLSGGQQQRVFLARALAQEAQILFLDEPFAGIDMTSESMIMELLKSLRDQGKTIFVVHHDLTKAESYFDSLILLRNKLIACGKREEVFKLEFLRAAYDGKVTTFGNQLLVVNG
jgi:manganese transport system ATP-binding protein